jgi:hypothetical protein
MLHSLKMSVKQKLHPEPTRRRNCTVPFCIPYSLAASTVSPVDVIQNAECQYPFSVLSGHCFKYQSERFCIKHRLCLCDLRRLWPSCRTFLEPVGKFFILLMQPMDEQKHAGLILMQSFLVFDADADESICISKRSHFPETRDLDGN